MNPRCAACKKRVTRGEPDLILRRMDPDNPMRTAFRLVYHVAAERGERTVADAYLEKRPKAQKRWEEFVEARQEADRMNRKLGNAMAYGLMKPPELSGMPVGGPAA